MNNKERLNHLIEAALEAARADGTLELETLPAPGLERPRDAANGDWASTVAMRTSKLAHKAPREVAEAVIAHLPENDLVEVVEVAGPGFINIRLRGSALQDVVRTIRTEEEGYGKGGPIEGRVNLEYVSANPTGPMHVGHGRWAALGDAMARVMRHGGYTVDEEFYINDHGTQLDVFGNSVDVRYQQLCGCEVEMPEQCYGGAYVTDIARDILEEDGEKWLEVPEEERRLAFRERSYKQMLRNAQRVLDGFGTTFDTWFSERSLYEVDESGASAVDRALREMGEKGYVYESDGATWFRSTAFGDEKDRVLIKENGEYTYFMSDVAYGHDKLGRGYEHLIDIWGADHHGYVKRCEAMFEAWGHPGVLEVVLGQLVNLFRNGEAVRMSKRTGEMVTFEELIDEVGPDATRYLMLSRSSDQPIDFDIEVAKKKDATNPVYYVQYAHARICSILRRAAEEESPELAAEAQSGAVTIDELAKRLVPLGCDLSPLVHESELALMRQLDGFPELIAAAARDRAPFRLTHYAQDLAAAFHQFYTNCHVLVDDAAVQTARLALCDATRIVLALTLSLLGVSAPTKM